MDFRKDKRHEDNFVRLVGVFILRRIAQQQLYKPSFPLTQRNIILAFGVFKMNRLKISNWNADDLVFNLSPL